MRDVLLALALIVGVMEADAQNTGGLLKITGHVIDSISAEPLDDIEVQIADSQPLISTTTENGGNFIINVSPTFNGKDIELQFRKRGYMDKRRTLRVGVENSQNALGTIRLRPRGNDKMVLGRVISQDGTELEGALVRLLHDVAKGKTDSNGDFSIIVSKPSLTSADRVALEISKKGYVRLDTVAFFDQNARFTLNEVVVPYQNYAWSVQSRVGFDVEDPKRYSIGLIVDRRLWKDLSLGVGVSMFKTYSTITYYQLPGVDPIIEKKQYNQFPLGAVLRYSPTVAWPVRPSILANVSRRSQQYLAEASVSLRNRVYLGMFLSYSHLKVKSQESIFEYAGKSTINNLFASQYFFSTGLSVAYRFDLSERD